MKCLHCNKVLEYAVALSECTQAVELNDNGVVIRWDAVDSIGTTKQFFCPDCDGDITDTVSED